MLCLSRGVLALTVLAMMRTACALEHGQEQACQYEVTSLSADDLTPWGTVVGDELAQLTGPYAGTWYWQQSHEYVEIANSGQSLPAWATLELDPDSYRLREHVGGGKGTVCTPVSIEADGVLTFRDGEDQELLRAPLTVFRGELQYFANEVLSPVEDYTTELVPNPEIEAQLDASGLSVIVNWGPEGESLYANVVYGGVAMLTDESGWGPSVYVAEFHQ